MTVSGRISHHPFETQLLELAGTGEMFGQLASEARVLTKEFLAQNHERAELLDAYESVVGLLYEEGRDEQAEELLEVMAELEGFCSPHARL